MLIRDFLQKELKFSKKMIIEAKSPEGYIGVNGVKRTVRYQLDKDDYLIVRLPNERLNSTLKGQYVPLDILYEDEHIMVINKEAGIPVIPSFKHPTHTIANGLIYYYEQLQLPYTVHLVTRLDKDTSGIMLIAKHRHAHYLLSEQMQKQQINRQYKALVHGVMKRDKGTICAPIARKENSIIERTVNPNGQDAVTHYEVMQRIGNYSLVRFILETGRTHQIRVHSAYVEHPLVGDSLYGKGKDDFTRQALHASELSFIHPINDKEMTFKIDLASDIIKLIKSIDN